MLRSYGNSCNLFSFTQNYMHQTVSNSSSKVFEKMKERKKIIFRKLFKNQHLSGPFSYHTLFYPWLNSLLTLKKNNNNNIKLADLFLGVYQYSSFIIRSSGHMEVKENEQRLFSRGYIRMYITLIRC